MRLTRQITLGLASAALLAGVSPIMAAKPQNGVTASFVDGRLTVTGDHRDNVIVVSRNPAGAILVNGGAVPIKGGVPTVANTSLVQILGNRGNDELRLDELNGALPNAQLFGHAGDDILIGGSGADLLDGGPGNDTLFGRGGADTLLGGDGNDIVTGGDGDDIAHLGLGNDRFIWNPGDDTDSIEGGDGIDFIEVNGGNGAEDFTVTANGTRVRFDRINPAPFALDLGTCEHLILNANGGDDTFAATGNLAALIQITVDGGAGNDTLLGSNGDDVLLGGIGDDLLMGVHGDDVLFGGAGNDTFVWNPGHGSDVIEGQAGFDTLQFNGSSASENIDVSSNGGRLRFFRNVGTIVMDCDGVERLQFNARGGADIIVVNELTGTAVTSVDLDLSIAANGGTGDNQPDSIVVKGTTGDDVVLVVGNATGVSVLGLSAIVNVVGSESARDRLIIHTLAGDDVVEASNLQAGAIGLTADGGPGSDVLIGSDGDDVLLGGDGDDVLLGGPGFDILDGGSGDNVVIQG